MLSSISRFCVFLGIVLILLVSGANFSWSEEPSQPEDGIKTAWGELSLDDPTATLHVTEPPTDGRLVLPPKLPQVVYATRGTTVDAREYLPIELNEDATEVAILAPGQGEKIELLTSERTRQLPTGEIIFAAREAKVHGGKAKLEEHPGNYRIGFWSNADDYATWNYNASRWGMYRVLLTYSTASPDGSEIEVEFSGQTVAGKLKSTGSWYRYNTLDLGTLYLAAQGKQTLTVRCTKKVGGAVMNLKAVILEPACEGTSPVQAEDGSLLLHGRDATVHGTRLRYEPAEKKQTLGYWGNADDSASWDFEIKQPGIFDVEVLQGCGNGQGGSEMEVSLLDSSSKRLHEATFLVEETGHFQNFKPRIVNRIELSEPGKYRLYLGPKKIAKSAACDVRQVRLIPVADDE